MQRGPLLQSLSFRMSDTSVEPKDKSDMICTHHVKGELLSVYLDDGSEGVVVSERGRGPPADRVETTTKRPVRDERKIGRWRARGGCLGKDVYRRLGARVVYVEQRSRWGEGS